MPTTPLRIVLDNPQEAYAAGDIINGKVYLDSPTDHQPGVVTITLLGAAETKIWPISKNNTGLNVHPAVFSATLVEHTEELRASQATTPATPSVFPFQIVIPSRVEPTSAGTWYNDAAFESNPSHTLPPSLSATYNAKDAVAAGFKSQFKVFEGNITYKLLATLAKPEANADTAHRNRNVLQSAISKLSINPSATTEMPLTIEMQPVQPMIHIVEKTWTEHFVSAPPAPAPKHSLFRRKSSVSNSTGDVPSEIPFDIDIAIPQCVHLGEKLGFTLRLRFPSSSALAVEVKYLAFSLFRHVNVRNIKPPEGTEQRRRPLIELSTRSLFSAAEVFEKANDHTLEYTCGELIANGPSFKTYNIRQHYSVVITLRIAFQGQSATRTVQAPIYILPRCSVRDIAPPYRPSEDEIGAPGEAPPNYHDTQNNSRDSSVARSVSTVGTLDATFPHGDFQQFIQTDFNYSELVPAEMLRSNMNMNVGMGMGMGMGMGAAGF